MAKRKVCYYKMNLVNNINNTEQTNNYKKLLDVKLDNYLNQNNKYSPIVLNNGQMLEGQRIDKVTLDIIKNDNQCLFARISKSKDYKQSLIRNEATQEISEVLSPDEIGFKTLEAYTYFLLDYTEGILAYVEGQQAAKITQIKNIFDQNDQYRIEIQNIASTDTIRSLLTEGSTIARINYDFRIPNPEILRGLGLPPGLIDVLGDTDVTNATIILKNEPRKNIANDGSIIRRLIEYLRPQNDNDKATVFGKVPGTTQQEYGFEFKNYSTPIDVPTTRTIDGQLEVLNIDEISQEYYTRMLLVYRKAIDTIHNLANI